MPKKTTAKQPPRPLTQILPGTVASPTYTTQQNKDMQNRIAQKDTIARRISKGIGKDIRDFAGSLFDIGKQSVSSVGGLFGAPPTVGPRKPLTPGMLGPPGMPLVPQASLPGNTTSPFAARWNELPDVYPNFGKPATPAPAPVVAPETVPSIPGAAGQQEAQNRAFMDWLTGSNINLPSINLPAQQPLPDINFSDLLAPYQGAINNANSLVQNAVSRGASENAAANEALRARLAQSYADAGNAYNQASGGAQADLSNLANNLGVGQALAGGGQQAWAQQDARLRGLAGLQQAGSLSSLDLLANQKRGAFDVAKQLGAGYAAQNLSGLANMLSGAEIEEELQRRQLTNDLSLAGINARRDLAELGMNMSDRERSRRFDLFKMMNDIAKQNEVENPVAVEEELTQMNPGLMAALQQIPDTRIRSAALDAYTSADNADEAYQKIQERIRTPKPRAETQGIFDYVGKTIGTLSDIPTLLAAAEAIRPFTSRYGGVGSRITTKTKGQPQ